MRSFCCGLVLSLLLTAFVTQHAQGQQHLRRPSGQPYLPPEQTPERFKLPEGFKAYLFAGEPDLANPIAMSFDDRGRLWVLECFEYPLGAPPGQKPRDRIKIFEDTDGDHRADKVTVFAEGFDLATGLAVGHGGAFVGVAPNLLFLRDTDGDDRADTQEVLLTGWGRHDTHELLNTFTWGPDGWLYGLHGVFTRSEVAGVYLDAAVWRYHPRLKKFELFAEGTSNPWGIDFDSRGRMFLTACVIPHLFYMIPGGRYIRQAGQNRNPYDYGQLREISDHLHHEESGWAHAGCVVLEGKLWPESLRGSVIFGSIHGCSIKRDVLEPRGSGFVARHVPDFLASGDRNVRPVNIQVGPDGALYVIDWHDQWPCHQTPPELWDKKRGRVYKLVPPGAETPRAFKPLSERSSAELVRLLDSDNPWWRRTALRVLAERRDRSVASVLRKQIADAGSHELRALRSLWALFNVGAFTQKDLELCLQSPHEWVRAWAIRLAVDAAADSVDLTAIDAVRLARDPSCHVRLSLASACQKVSDGQWVDRAVRALAANSADASDPNLPLMIWFAMEPRVARAPDDYLGWLEQASQESELVRRHLVERVVRRVADLGTASALESAVRFAAARRDQTVLSAALRGLAAALEGERHEAPNSWPRLLHAVRRSGKDELMWLAVRIGASFRDPATLDELARILRSERARAERRRVAVRLYANAAGRQASPLLLELTTAPDVPGPVRREALFWLGRVGDVAVARQLVAKLSELPAEDRQAAVLTLASRGAWAHALLDGLAAGTVQRDWITANVAERINRLGDRSLQERLSKLWGTVRQRTPDEIARQIDYWIVRLRNGRGDPKRGKEVFRKKCGVCHTFRGEGQKVGPDLTGADRSVQYLLINIIDPNRVVGLPYFQHAVLTRSGQVITGKLVEESPERLVLEMEEGRRVVVPKDEIEEHQVRPISVMPEGLLDDLSEREVRDLIEYLRR